MKARQFAKEIHLNLTLREFDELYGLLEVIDEDEKGHPQFQPIFEKMKEIKKRLLCQKNK